MDGIVAAVNYRYNLTRSDVWNGDPRVKDWFLMDNLGGVLCLTLLYLLMVKQGPTFMAKRAAFNLTSIMVLYNFALVVLSAYIFYEMLAVGILRRYSFLCQPINYDNTDMGLREASVSWWYFFSKVIELLDTVLFIIRKKNNQVTFLHVYHHSTMLLICWYVAKYVPGGEKFYNGGFNSLVHVFMYTYYGLAAMGPHMQKHLWWKRYLTEFQLIQFTFVNIRSVGSFFTGPCEYPRWINWFALFYSSSLMGLFLNFYFKSYKAKRTKTVANGEHNGISKTVKEE